MIAAVSHDWALEVLVWLSLTQPSNAVALAAAAFRAASLPRAAARTRSARATAAPPRKVPRRTLVLRFRRWCARPRPCSQQQVHGGEHTMARW